MISAGDLGGRTGAAAAIDLFRRLGYPVEPVEIDAAEWRRGRVEIPWNDEVSLRLLARLQRLDMFLLEGAAGPEQVRIFLSSYSKYNQLTKSALIKCNDETVSVFDLNSRSVLRRFDIDLRSPSPHSLDRLNLLALPAGDGAEVAQLFDRALDREAIGRQFFIRFRSAVHDLGATLHAGCPAESSESIAAEALLILSRLLFLSFIQEKGWLNGERRFLIDRARRAVRERRDFFAAVLMPLFFGCLNTPSSERDDASRLLGTIPYLNGGLFEPSAFERRNLEISVDNTLMLRILEEVFEKFDFRIDEDDTAGAHVDPEMLGKVFESLMADDERAVSGSFYTPKEIVDVLTSRAIAEWAGGGDRAVHDALLRVINGEKPPRELSSSSETVLARLRSITILDPACGSGAFLLSSMQALERCIRALSTCAPENLRQQIVERSLYGVDLKPEAVRLCELRLWLAIVAGSDATPETIRPLPNLDRNIQQGNSLVSPLDFLGSARADVYRQWAYGLRAQQSLIERYRSAARSERPALHRLLRSNDQRIAADLLTSAIDADESELQSLTAPRRDLFGDHARPDLDRCRALERRIGDNRRAIASVEEGQVGFFSFDVHFATVVARGGFDLVTGNPPWVRNGRIEPDARALYRERYRVFGARGGAVAFHQPDLSIAFLERAVSLAAPDGVVAMLMPAKIANAAYAGGLRQFLHEETSILSVADWSDDRRRYFRADTFPLGLVVRKARPGRNDRADVTASGENFSVAQRDLRVAGAGSEWSLVAPGVRKILARLRDRLAPLEQELRRKPIMGVKTGDNRSFFLDGDQVDSGWLFTKGGIAIPTEYICRCVRGRDLRRWRVSDSHWMLWPPAAGWRDLPPWLQQVAVAARVEPDRLRLSYVRPEHVGIKVAWKDVSRGMAAAVLPDTVLVAGHSFPLVPNQTLYSVDAVSLDEAYVVAAILNSVIAGALLVAVAERAKDDHYRYFGRTVGRIPIPAVLPGDQRWGRLLRASRAAHGNGVASPDLDCCVAELYEVTLTELEVLRAFLARRIGAR